MKFFNQLWRWQHQYLAWDSAAIVLGCQAGVLSMLFSFAYLCLPSPDLSLIFAIFGVFLAALIQTMGLRTRFLRRIKYTVAVSVSAGIATWLGCLAGNYFGATALGLLFMLPVVAYTSNADYLLSASILFVVNSFVIGSGMPATLNLATIHALAFSAGGCLLALCSWLCAVLLKQASPLELLTPPLSLKRLFHNYQDNHHFAWLLTVAVSLGNAFAWYWPLPQRYWIPMTALLILKADHDFSKVRITHRLWGTFLGSFLAILLLFFVENKYVLAWLMLPLLFFIVIGLARHYGAYTVFLTIMVCVMINFVEANGYLIVEHRLLDTVIGVLSVVVVLWCIYPVVKFSTKPFRLRQHRRE